MSALTAFVLSPEFFAGVMAGLALTKFFRTAYTEVLSRVLSLDDEDE